MSACTNCKQSIRPGSPFCSKCGARQGGERGDSPAAAIGQGLSSLGSALVTASKNLAEARRSQQIAPSDVNVPPVIYSAHQERPFGMVIAVLYTALHGLLSFLGGATLLFAGQIADTLGQYIGWLGYDQSTGVLVTFIGIVQIIIGFLRLSSCYGLWSYQRWGRTLALTMFTILVILQFFSLFTGTVTASRNLISVFFIACGVALLFYLNRADVKGRFQC